MAAKQNKPPTHAEKARALRSYVDTGIPIDPEKAAWLKAYEAKAAAALAKKSKDGRLAEGKARAKAKKEKRAVTTADLHEAMRPVRPPSRAVEEVPEAVYQARAALDLALEEGRSVETLAHAKALAIGAFPRIRTGKRSVTNYAKIGRTDWLAVTYTAIKPGVDLAFGNDVLAVIALVDAVRRERRLRFDFDSMTALVAGLGAAGKGGKQNDLAEDRLARVAGTAINLSWFKSEGDARAAKDSYRSVNFTVIRDWWTPGADRAGEALIKPYLEISGDFAEHTLDVRNLLFLPVEVVRVLSDHPLALQVFLYVYGRCLGTFHEWEEPFEEFMAALNETKREPRKLVRDVETALRLVHTLTGNRLAVKLVEMPTLYTGKQGRAGKRWAFRFSPWSKPLTRKPRPALSSTR